ncbi:MAG: RNA 2',3'-cyclic phosphodiesterase [Pirellulales bacterium]
MSNIIRTFVAVEIPLEVKDRAQRMIAQLRATDAKVKWVAAAHMHWTLKFLGHLDMLDIPPVCEAVKRAVEPLAAFDIEALGAGAFPDVGRPRTVWIGTGQGSEQMIELHDAIEFELAKLGYRSENRRFRPHLTIGRVRQSPAGIGELGRLIEQHADFDGGVSLVDEVVVISSELSPDGPIYEPLCHAELKGH